MSVAMPTADEKQGGSSIPFYQKVVRTLLNAPQTGLTLVILLLGAVLTRFEGYRFQVKTIFMNDLDDLQLDDLQLDDLQLI